MLRRLIASRYRPTLEQLLARGATERALRLVDDALADQPGDPALMELRARVLVRLGRHDEAGRTFLEIADEMVGRGFGARAIALLRQAEACVPPPPGIELRLDSAAALSFLDDVSASPLFEMFTRDELVTVVRGLEVLTFEPGQILMVEGEPGDSLFVIASGQVRIHARFQALLRPREVDLMRAPQFFGEIALLHKSPRTATVTAASRVDVLVLTARSLERIVETQPRVRDVLTAFAEQRLARIRAR